MTKATKTKTAPGNDDLANAQSLVKRHLEQALLEREADIQVLQQLILQVPDASPYLIKKFAVEASRQGSRLVSVFTSSEFGYFDAEGKAAPFFGNDDDVVRLDAFLSYHLTEEALRCKPGYSSYQYEAS
jgi:hypothetical protein